jgi:hypothetical protein
MTILSWNDCTKIRAAGCATEQRNELTPFQLTEPHALPVEHITIRLTQPLFTSPRRGEVGMGALRAAIPGEGGQNSLMFVKPDHRHRRLLRAPQAAKPPRRREV